MIQGNYGNGVHLNTVSLFTHVFVQLSLTLLESLNSSEREVGGSMVRLALQITNTSSVD